MKRIFRNNIRGFTLVELIVVIAIMAVLAGTVAGATVGILNKYTDKANYEFQAKEITARIQQWIYEVYENPARFFELTQTPPPAETSVESIAESLQLYADGAYNLLRRTYPTLKWCESYGIPDKKGYFSADASADDMAIYLLYRGKSKGYAEVGYKILFNAVTGTVSVEPFEGFLAI